MHPNMLNFVDSKAADSWVYTETILNNSLQGWGLKRPRKFMKEKSQN